MKEPDKIYVSIGYEAQTKPFHHSIEYIRKDALLEWAKEKNKMIDTEDGDYSLGYVSAMIDLIEKIESI